jgi:hypothetical protein
MVVDVHAIWHVQKAHQPEQTCRAAVSFLNDVQCKRWQNPLNRLAPYQGSKCQVCSDPQYIVQQLSQFRE